MWMRTGEKQNGKYGGGYERSAKGRVGGIRVGLKKKKKVETISEGLRMRSGDRCGNREKGREAGILCGAGLALTCSYDRTQEDFNACGP